jgi:predicted amidohydrolase
MNEQSEFTIAAIQAEPVYFDREASTQKACKLIRRAGELGAVLAAFSESWLPGYPFFVWGSLVPAFSKEYLANGVEIPSETTERLCEAAKEAELDVVIGIAERDTVTHGTVYCTLLFIGRDGEILGRHRKLKPTHRERTAWGEGDGSSLVVYDRSYAKISGLNCWEHNMVLPGYVLMAQGTQVHIAAWPGQHHKWSRHIFLSRAFASQAAAYVIDVGAKLSYENLREDQKEFVDGVDDTFRDLVRDYPGESCIIDPRGEIIAGPTDEETILIAQCSMDNLFSAKAACDVGGHYSRPDVFQLHVSRSAHRRILEMERLSSDAENAKQD